MADVEKPKVAQIVIKFDFTAGRLEVKSSQTDKVLLLGMLEMAKDFFKPALVDRKSIITPPPPTLLVPKPH